MLIRIPEGYNGHSYLYHAEPLVDNGNSVVILRCAEPGKEYMTRWCHRETWQAACKESAQG